MLRRTLVIALFLAHLPQSVLAEPEPTSQVAAAIEPMPVDAGASARALRLLERRSIRLRLSFAEWAADALRFGDLLLSTRVVALAGSFELLASWVMAPARAFGLAPDEEIPASDGTVSVHVEPYFARSAKGLAARATF